jgi:hypothetical protein
VDFDHLPQLFRYHQAANKPPASSDTTAAVRTLKLPAEGLAFGCVPEEFDESKEFIAPMRSPGS